jgi:hypothetical protein
VLKFVIGLARILSRSKKSFDKIQPLPQFFVPAVTMPIATGNSVKAPIEQDSSDDDFSGFDEDGGVELDHDDTDKSNVTPEQEQFHGVHPDRVRSAGNGAGPNGRDMFSV